MRSRDLDLAAHRAARRKADVTALERDIARLLPHLTPRERLEARALGDAARDNITPLDTAHQAVRHALSHHTRKAA